MPVQLLQQRNLNFYNVKDFGAVGDGVTNDIVAITSAILAAFNAGGGIVFFPPGTYSIGSSIIPKSKITLLGSGAASIIVTTYTGTIINATTQTFSDFVVDSLTFQGTVNQFPTVPTRARATSGVGCNTAIYLDGDLDPYASSPGTITNFTMRNCIVRNCSALPIRIGGVHGTVKVIGNTFENNQDVGFIYNQEVIFSDNHVLMSADNGVSISRGNNKVTCTGNTFENCCYNGIWLTGFDDGSHNLNLVGPTHFSCTGNTIINVGYNCIIADQAPQNGVIAGNTCDQGYFRGPVDGLLDTNGAGIFIAGFPATARSSPTAYAQNIQVTGNTLFQCARAGIYLSGVKAIGVDANLILNCGTQYLADGVTAIASSSSTQNVGILIDNTATNTDVIVRNNTTLDERGTPYTNFAIAPQVPPSSYVYWFNHMAGCRNAYNLIDFQTVTRELSVGMRYDVNAKYVLGATAGSNGGTGTIFGFDTNGAAASTRLNRILTGGIARWGVGGNNDAESGSNAGTNFAITSYDDTGTLISTPLKITRGTGKIDANGLLSINGHVIGGGTTPTIVAGAQSASAAFASSGGTDTAGSVNTVAVASPVAGTIATVTFATAYAAPPHVVIVATNQASAALQLYVSTRNTTSFVVSSNVAAGNGVAVNFDYIIVA